MNINDPGIYVLSIILALIGLVIQGWVITLAVRRALQDHTIWRYTKWPEIKARIDKGEYDPKEIELR